jgi:hypothetical protein
MNHSNAVVVFILASMSLQVLLNESQQSGSGPHPNVNDLQALLNELQQSGSGPHPIVNGFTILVD